MNLIKVQQEVIKALCNGEKVRRMDLADDNVLVTYNFITAYAIRRADLFLDLDKLLPWELKIPESHKQHEAEKTGVLVEAGGALLRKFKTSSGNAYAQEKDLKHFDKYARFYFHDNAFYVYENGERFAGIVMAFKHEEEPHDR